MHKGYRCSLWFHDRRSPYAPFAAVGRLRALGFLMWLFRRRPPNARVHKANIAIAAANMAKVVIPTTTRESTELGCPCMSLRSQATSRSPTRRKGASNPLMTEVQNRAFTGLMLRKIHGNSNENGKDRNGIERSRTSKRFIQSFVPLECFGKA